MPKKALRRIYQLKVTLMESKPPIWRRLLVPSSISLPKFHDVLQIAMGWTDSHLHQFVVGGRLYGKPDPDFESDTIDERHVRLDRSLKKEKDSILYQYDFGDGWEHKIELEKLLPFDPGTTLPACVKGKRACPPEDVGGIWRYQEFLHAIRDSTHPEHEEYLEWVGGEFDPEYFSVAEINELLSEYCVNGAQPHAPRITGQETEEPDED